MSETDYKALYEREKRHREEIERKYNELVSRVRPLLQTIDQMSEPARQIEGVMQEFAKLQKSESVGDGHEV